MRLCFSLCVLLFFCLAVSTFAGDHTTTNQPPKRSFKAYAFSVAEPESVFGEVRGIVGTEGRVIHDSTNGRLLVIATPEQHELIAELIKSVTVAPRNVQIQVRIVDAGSSVERGASANVRGTVVVPHTERSGVAGTIRLQDQTTHTSRDSTQLITVMSGGSASISVGEEVPFVDWFFDYGVRCGYLQPTIRWQQVGARLVVEPHVLGDGKYIRVSLVPELSYLVDGKNLVTAFVNAATEVTVANGQEMRIGGSTGNQEFMSRFLIGYDSTRNRRAVDIILKPTILESVTP
jgi:type II secretory pathway component GspD/PulD (secretin)